jgi:hypothetical protein
MQPELLYPSTLSASEARIGGTPSTMRFSLGEIVPVWVKPGNTGKQDG